MPTFYERRQLVTPGDLVAEGNYIAGENTFKENEKLYATRVGLVEYEERRVSVVALKAFYIPTIGDTIIGKVTDVTMGGWILDINAPYLALLRASDVMERSYRPQRDELSSIFDVGDLVIAKIVSYDRTRDPLLTVREPGLGKITRGQILEITPTKIPRIIGRKGSMIGVIKRETGCHILLGQNGLVLISGKNLEDEQLAVMAIRKIENESHTSGLTDRVTDMLKKEKEKEGETKNA
ncbi:MAG: exosome complex RNA-binding protein Rrp4 [Candidatus Bathyarchaeota archaeon]|nr:exosome complex RNA-binding protein Rrp4 [Candidatus Bathyarchaeota archaeon]MDH5494899.1 exosome complex RNA-binding protein Rrp4 [Candidatus Bathyarchaeota archaeon]